ncbi:endonuclease [Anaerocolumna cellulosilytica]|uniref:Endonuclease n=1 Tax=Anaerocolumna cellulosilytica TaxID=433286 RepID=A0A6S6R0A0_9FIRM|nr:hypothetical protein [Anaerocolumna cellulosilytica]BCJ96344.1 endonuclease [Anaerocolumna cellulosilytica]
MAITKLLYMKDCGGNFHGKHLKSALEYVMNVEKTQNGSLIGGINCQPDTAFEQMKETKRKFNKIGKRQGYHLILSFQEEEVTPDTAFEITQKFVSEYLGKSYEAVFVVHDNTDHVHSHIIFNSVSFVDGKKYRYEKGEWAKEIQPITNRLCEAYGLSTIEIEEEARKEKRKSSEHYKEWNEYRDGKFLWSDMIKRDLDACVLQAGDYESFLELLSEKGYEIKEGKHLALKPQGMMRYRRCDTLGTAYTEEAIRERVITEDLNSYRSSNIEEKPQIFHCHVKRYKRAKLSGLQKKYYGKLYRLGQLKKKPYSQVWKYRREISKMQQLQAQYLFLARHDIYSIEELSATLYLLEDSRKGSNQEKSRVYRDKQKMKSLFDLTDEMKALLPAEKAYQQGDKFFWEEHETFQTLTGQLEKQGYSYEEVEKLREYYRGKVAEVKEKETVIRKELRVGQGIWKELWEKEDSRVPQKEQKREEQMEKRKEDGREQPTR